MKIPKIQTLWKRDEENKFIIIPGEYSEPIFEFVDRWIVSEKIHGMNVRVIYEYALKTETLKFSGKTDNSQLPIFLFKKLMDLFDKEKLRKVFVTENEEGQFLPIKVVLYGEGYGAGIQKGGGNYIKNGVDFALFDVYVYAEENRTVKGWWLERHNVKDIAKRLEISYVAEFPEILTKADIIDLVKQPVPSAITENKDYIAEGVVARADPPILFRNGHPVVFKLKVEDYENLEKFGK